MKKFKKWTARVLLAVFITFLFSTGAPKGTHGWGYVWWTLGSLLITGIFIFVFFKLFEWAFDD